MRQYNPHITSYGIYGESNLNDLARVFQTYLPNKSFIDLGSGLGHVVEFAKRFTVQATGVEIEPYLHNFATDHATRGDLFLRSFRAYDVLYYYWLGVEAHREPELIKKIEDELKVGSHVIFYHKDIQPQEQEELYGMIKGLNLVESFPNGRVYKK